MLLKENKAESLIRIFFLLILLTVFFLSLSLIALRQVADKDFIRQQLHAMVETDQVLRKKINHSHPNEQLIEEIKRQNVYNLDILRAILKDYYWITISEFGIEANKDAWLLVQHADHDIKFQKEILVKLEKLYPIHETKSEHYAYLYDRIAKNENRPQKYGTQGSFINSVWVPYEIEDFDNLDERRKSIGLSSFQEYKNNINQFFSMKKSSESPCASK